jgi:hypothetical protein
MKVILSTTILLEEGVFKSQKITQEAALNWVEENKPTCYSNHQTVKLVGINPESVERIECTGYTQALVLKPLKRLVYGVEYSLEEIKDIGVEYVLVSKMD